MCVWGGGGGRGVGIKAEKRVVDRCTWSRDGGRVVSFAAISMSRTWLL